MQSVSPAHKGKYIVAFEVFHQLHCLNLIRQFTWLDRYIVRPSDLRGSLVENRMHVDHCIETLRLALMCNADVTPFLIRDRNNGATRAPLPDFDTFHKCKKWEPLVEWVKRNTWQQSSSGELRPESDFKQHDPRA